MSTYTEAMEALQEAMQAAVAAADNEDGAPVMELRLLARDVDSLIDTGLTYQEARSAQALYDGAKAAGLVP